jgi:dipeptidase E
MKIVAIGGGEIGRPGYPVETTKIDKEIIKLTGKIKPKLLFISTASGDSDVYLKTIKKHFGERLGCTIFSLRLLKYKFSKDQIEKKILNSDIVYVGGGNTLKMLKVWRQLGVDKTLKKALEKGVVLSGVSAGANCWFKYSNSDSRIMEGVSKDYIFLPCLGFVKAVMCPHYDAEKGRQISLKKHMKDSNLVAIALGNCSALEITGDQYRIITSKKDAVAYKVFWENGHYFRRSIINGGKFMSLEGLLKK